MCVSLPPFSSILFFSKYTIVAWNVNHIIDWRQWLCSWYHCWGVFSDGESSSCRKESPRCLFLQTSQHHRRRDRATAPGARSGLNAPYLYECLHYKSVKHEYKSLTTVAGTILCSIAKVATQGATLATSIIYEDIWRHASKDYINPYILKCSSALNYIYYD